MTTWAAFFPILRPLRCDLSLPAMGAGAAAGRVGVPWSTGGTRPGSGLPLGLHFLPVPFPYTT